MKKFFIFFLGALFLLGSNTTNAQNVWSLQKCIDYALENNIQIKQQEINTNYYENQLSQAKSNRLPNLNAQIGNDYNFGRTLTPSNIYVNTNSTSVTGGAGLNLTIFDATMGLQHWGCP